MNNNTYNNWADLPEEILELIGNRLDNRIDVYRFRAICRSWRSVVPLSLHSSPQYPVIRLPPPYSATAFLSPFIVCRLENEIRTAACLIKVTQSDTGEMKITNPLSHCTRMNKINLDRKKSVNILSLRVVGVCRGYYLKFDQNESYNGRLIKKTVLFGKCGVLVIFNVGWLRYFGFEDDSWTVLGTEGVKYEDIAVYNGHSYAVDSLGTVYWIDGNTMSLIQYSPPLFGLGQAKNLVVSDGDLFVVEGTEGESQNPVIDFEIADMRVYRLDEEWGTWVNVRSLGDRVFVLGKDVCFSVSSRDFPGCSRNCVYFLDTKLEIWTLLEGSGRFIGRVFDIEDGGRMKTVDSFLCHRTHRKLFSVPMNFPCTSGTSSLFEALEALE